MKRIYVLPNVITAFGLSCGLFVIFKMNMTEVGQVTQELLVSIAGILVLAALADLLDGAVARAMKAESEFGTIFDSLADAITFGVAPSVIVLKSLSVTPGSQLSFFITTAAIVYSICGILRLARFGVQAQQSKENQIFADSFKKNFTGLPIPAAASAIVSMNLLLASDELKAMLTLSEGVRAIILCCTLLLIGYFMICRWKFPSFKSLHVRVASFHIVFYTVIAAVCLFYGLLHYFPLVFFGFSWLYLVLGWTLSLARAFSDKRSKTLEDFEPDPEPEFDDGDVR
jgi:CDP-diacylglycerol--serine O-phosphatidyltransferase